MSNSSASGKVSGRRSAFSQTFNLLSQYVKENKSIGDISLGMFGNSDDQGQNDAFRPTTMNLFPVNQKSAKSMDLFPQQTGFASQSSEIQSSPLTIFYGGQVIVVNDFPAHKAKEIMELANRGASQKSSTTPLMKNTAQNIQESSEQPTTTVVADLPIARKASLHRFLEKRKDRIKAKAPYNTSKTGDLPLKATDESNPWLGLAAAPPS
ncbi:hypothetical protein V2J09_002483 [Rumex salicifolius]